MPTKQQALQAIADSEQHWEEMRAWAREQINEGMGSAHICQEYMEGAICQSWGGEDCPLCQLFSFSYKRENSAFCMYCPLKLIGELCNNQESTWRTVSDRKTFTDWLTASDRMMDALNRAKQWVMENLNDGGENHE